MTRIGSLCSGYGGLDLAVMDVLGGSVAWHCQYDPDDRHQYAARILDHHWPDVPNHGDIAAVDWAQVEPVDVLTAGFPCQDLSYAGQGAGIKEGTRSGLWYAVARAIGALRPGLVVLENVRAIVGRRPGLDVVLAGLADLGFDAEWVCVPASDVDAPHQRYRWFLLAWPAADAEGVGRGEGRAEPAGILRGPDVALGGRAVVADAADLEHERCWPARERWTGPENGDLTPADAAGERHGDAGQASERGVPSAAFSGVAADSARVGDQNKPRRDAQQPVLAEPGAVDRADLRHRPEGAGEHGRGAGVVAWGAYGPAVRRWEHVLGRPAPRPVDDRGRLSPRFVEWMMGLPAGHVTDVPAPPGMRPAGLRNAQLKALGNGVVPQQAVYALRLLLSRIASEAAA